MVGILQWCKHYVIVVFFGRLLSSEWEATRIEVLHWMSTLFNRYYDEVINGVHFKKIISKW